MAKRHLTRERILDRARVALGFPTRAEEAAEDARFEQVMRSLVITIFIQAGAAQLPEFHSLVRDLLKPTRRAFSKRMENLTAFLFCVSFPTEMQVYFAAMLLPMIAKDLHYQIEVGPPRVGQPHPFHPAPVAPSYDKFCERAERDAGDGGTIDDLADWLFNLLERHPAPAGGKSREQGRNHWKALWSMRPAMDLPRPEDFPECLDFERAIVRCAARYREMPEPQVKNLFGAARARKHYYNPVPRRTRA